MEKLDLLVNRIVIDKLNFQLCDNSNLDDKGRPEGKAEVNVNFSEKNDEKKLQPINVELNLDYEDSNYKVETRIFGYYNLYTKDFSRFIKDIDNFQEELQTALLNPLLTKLRLHIGLLSEGKDGLVKIPNLSIDYSKAIPKTSDNEE